MVEYLNVANWHKYCSKTSCRDLRLNVIIHINTWFKITAGQIPTICYTVCICVLVNGKRTDFDRAKINLTGHFDHRPIGCYFVNPATECSSSGR